MGLLLDKISEILVEGDTGTWLPTLSSVLVSSNTQVKAS